MTHTINELYLTLKRYLKQKNDPQPDLTARELCAFVCKADKRKTAEWAHRYIDEGIVRQAADLAEQVLSGTPLAYILGEWDFYGLTFKVSEGALIPRADTEVLCQLAVERAARRVSPRVLDLCCGTGCIGITIAHLTEDAKVCAVDIEDVPLALTRENARRLARPSQVVALRADVRHAPPHGMGQFDILTCNPPYITREEMQALDRSVAAYEPIEALYGGEDGLDFYRAVLHRGWADLLVPGGLLLFEVGYRQAEQVAALMQACPFDKIKITNDLCGIGRVVSGVWAGQPLV